MPRPRAISSTKRLQMVQLITRRVKTYTGRLSVIISDLKKPHVDSIAKAKKVLAMAEKLKKKLAA